MRIVNLETFLTLPEGTIYTEYENMSFGKLCKKEENCDPETKDFFFTPLGHDVVSTSSGKSEELLTKAETDPTIDLPLDYDISERDGLYKDDRLFCILSKDDVDTLIEVLAFSPQSRGVMPVVTNG